MYNHFELVGKIENITADTIDINADGESLEVVATGLLQKLDSAEWLRKGEYIIVKGKITTNHLQAEHVRILGGNF